MLAWLLGLINSLTLVVGALTALAVAVTRFNEAMPSLSA